jgi:putative FmdB family regulatory protein
MPRYIYKCTDCQIIIEASHSIKEKMKDCTSCGIKNTLKRLPTSFTVTKKHTETSKNVGDVTKEKIEQFREELQKDKKKLQEEEYTA